MQLLFFFFFKSGNYTYLFHVNHSKVVLFQLCLFARHVKSISLDILGIEETPFPFKYMTISGIDGAGIKPKQPKIKFLHQQSPSAVPDG